MCQGGAGALTKKHGDGSLLMRLSALCLGKGKAEAMGGVLDQIIEFFCGTMCSSAKQHHNCKDFRGLRKEQRRPCVERLHLRVLQGAAHLCALLQVMSRQLRSNQICNGKTNHQRLHSAEDAPRTFLGPLCMPPRHELLQSVLKTRGAELPGVRWRGRG